MVRIKLATRKHRIGMARIVAVLDGAHTIVKISTNRGEPGVLYLGFDDRGRELAVIVVEQGDVWLVVHAQPTNYVQREKER